MDTKKPGTSSAEGEDAVSKPEEPLKTPSRPGKGIKRKYQSPVTPSSKPDAEKSGSAKKRRKSASGTPVGGWSGSPAAGTPLKPAMTERQQMALLLQMTDPQKQTSVEQSPLPSSTETTPRSRVQRRNERGETPLHLACIKGDLKTATSLIEQGAEVNAVDNAGWTPLHEACNHGHSVIAGMLLQHEAKVNVRGMEGDTPLHDAVVNGHLECVKILLEHGADPTLANEKGLTPLETCVHPEIRKVLTADLKDDSEPDVFESSDEKSTEEDKASQKSADNENPIPLKLEHDKNEPAESKTVSGVDAKTTESSDTEADSKKFVAHSRKRARGLFFSDISSSESESEHTEMRGGVKRSKLSFPDPKQQLEKLSEDEEAISVNKVASAEEPEEEKEEAASKTQSDDTPAMKGADVTAEAPPTPPTEAQSVAQETEDKGDIAKNKERPKSTELDQPSSSPAHATEPKPKHSEPSAPTITTKSQQQQQRHTGEEDKQIVSKVQKESKPETESAPATSSPPLQRKQSRSTPPSVSRAHLARAMKSPQPSVGIRATRSSLIVSYSLSVVKPSLVDVDDDGSESKEQETLRRADSHKESLRNTDHSEPSERPNKDKDIASESPLSSKLDSSKLPGRDSLPERHDSTSSQDSRSGEKHTKHSRKPQHVIPSRKVGKKEESKARGDLDSDENGSNSFSISLDWGVLSSSQQTPKSGTSPKLIVQSSISPSSGHVQNISKTMYDDSEEKSDDSDASKSTVISLSTSLPIVFSGLRDSHHTVTTSSSTTLTKQSQPQQQQPNTGSDLNPPVKDTLTTPTSFKPKTLPIILEAVKSASAPSTPQKKEKTSSGAAGHAQQSAASVVSSKGTAVQSEVEDSQARLPPKRRHRAVYRSAVAQQRRIKQDATPSEPAHLSSFLMSSGKYRSKKLVQPTNPKTVYPPMSTALYKLFNEQENERVKLIAAHLTEQDRMVISMEQEVLRAHQRATKSHTVISACSLLLEQLLPKTLCERSNGDVAHIHPNITSPSSQKQKDLADESVDSKLLTGLIQDVWDKFYQLKISLFTRQRHEAEALWMVQRSSWIEKLTELGFSKSSTRQEVPSTHVPIASSNSFIEN